MTRDATKDWFILISQAPSGSSSLAWRYGKFEIPIIKAPSGSRDGIRRCGRAVLSATTLVCVRAGRAVLKDDGRRKTPIGAPASAWVSEIAEFPISSECVTGISRSRSCCNSNSTAARSACSPRAAASPLGARMRPVLRHRFTAAAWPASYMAPRSAVYIRVPALT
jgi:hypothetical protein